MSLNIKQQNEVVNLYHKGYSQGGIALSLDVTRNAVTTFLREHKLIRALPKYATRRAASADKDLIKPVRRKHNCPFCKVHH